MKLIFSFLKHLKLDLKTIPKQRHYPFSRITTYKKVLIICVLDSIICVLDFCLLDFYFIALDYMRTRFLQI